MRPKKTFMNSASVNHLRIVSSAKQRTNKGFAVRRMPPEPPKVVPKKPLLSIVGAKRFFNAGSAQIKRFRKLHLKTAKKRDLNHDQKLRLSARFELRPEDFIALHVTPTKLFLEVRPAPKKVAFLEIMHASEHFSFLNQL
jgi:hypothetical protein